MECINTLEVENPSIDIQKSLKSNVVYSMGYDGHIESINFSNSFKAPVYSRVTQPISQFYTIFEVEVSNEGERFFLGQLNGDILRVGPKNIKVMRGHFDSISSLRQDFGNKILVSTSYDGYIRIWNKETLKQLSMLPKSSQGSCIASGTFSGQKEFAVSRANRLEIWDIFRGSKIEDIKAHEKGIMKLRFDNNLLYTGSRDGEVKAWDTRSKSNSLEISCEAIHTFGVQGKSLVVGSSKGEISIFDLRNTKNPQIEKQRAHRMPIATIRFCDEDKFVTTSLDSLIKFWDINYEFN